jgi:hypothetical protein
VTADGDVLGPVRGRGVVASRDALRGAVVGWPRIWLRLEGFAALLAGAALYLRSDGDPIWLVPLVLAVDVSMVGYLAGPGPGSITYNLAHNWAVALLVIGAGVFLAVPALVLAGAVLVAHVGFDRLAGYGLKYPTGFSDTHLGRIGRQPQG